MARVPGTLPSREAVPAFPPHRGRCAANHLEGAALGDAAASALALLRHRAHKRGVEIVSADFESLPRVELGADELRQVVLNLLLNAIEATPAGGRVWMGASPESDFLSFRISDEGTGIPPELREEVFTAFYSTRAERSGGLGLAITRRIVPPSRAPMV